MSCPAVLLSALIYIANFKWGSASICLAVLAYGGPVSLAVCQVHLLYATTHNKQSLFVPSGLGTISILKLISNSFKGIGIDILNTQ